MKKWELLAANVATEDDPDGMLGECDEKGAGGFWDYAGRIADEICVDLGTTENFTFDLLQSALYTAIKDLFEEVTQ